MTQDPLYILFGILLAALILGWFYFRKPAAPETQKAELRLQGEFHPTRLRILNYLAEEALTPAQLARRLRLRAPTVIHHLKALRLAGLVQLTLGEDKQDRRYAARPEAVRAAYDSLQGFLGMS